MNVIRQRRQIAVNLILILLISTTLLSTVVDLPNVYCEQ